MCVVLPSSEEGPYCVLSRCQGSSVGIVTKIRAGLSRNRSIPGGGSGRQRQTAVATNTAVNAVSIPIRPSGFVCCFIA